MRFSPASRLRDRQTVWVGFANDGTVMDKRHHGLTAVTWAQQFAEIFEADAQYNRCPVSGWRSRQGNKRGL